MSLERSLRTALLTALMITAACHRGAGPWALDAAQRDYFPLHSGTLWVYEVRDAEGNVALERVLVRGIYYLRSVETVGILVDESGGYTGELGFDVAWHPVVYYRRGAFFYKSSGVNYVDEEIREYTLGEGEEKVLPTNPVEHPRWESDFALFQAGPSFGYGSRMTSVAEIAAEPVAVRAGIFRRCLRVDSESVLATRPHEPGEAEVRYRYIDWYAPGVGLVKSLVSVIAEPPRPVSTRELISFRDGREHD